MKRAILFETPADETILNAYGESVVSFHTRTAPSIHKHFCAFRRIHVERNIEVNEKNYWEDRYALVPSSVRCSVSQA